MCLVDCNFFWKRDCSAIDFSGSVLRAEYESRVGVRAKSPFAISVSTMRQIFTYRLTHSEEFGIKSRRARRVVRNSGDLAANPLCASQLTLFWI